MFSMQAASQNAFKVTFQFSSVASLNLGWSQNGVLGNSLILSYEKNFKTSTDDNFYLGTNELWLSDVVDDIVGKEQTAAER